MGDFGAQTSVGGGTGTYTAELSEDWRIWGPMGGYIATVALRAASAEVDPALRPASFTCQFLAPASFESVELTVDVRRATRRTAAVAVEVAQQGRLVLDAQVWFAAESDEGAAHDHAPRHGHGHPDDHPDIRELVDEDEQPLFPFWENFEVRPVDWVEDWESYPGGEPIWAEWLRFTPVARFDDLAVEVGRLVLLCDLPSYPAALRAYPGNTPRDWIAPSLDLSVQLHRVHDLSDWLLCQGTAPIADRGFIGFRSEVWTSDGVLAASGSGQLICRPMPAG